MEHSLSKWLKEDEEVVKNWLQSSLLRAGVLLGFLAFLVLLAMIFVLG